MIIDPGQGPQIDALKQSTIQGKKEESTVSNGNAASSVINLSDSAKKLHNQIKNSDSYDEVRSDVVAAAKTDLEEWKGLSDDQIDQIMNRMIDEMNI